MKLVVTIDMDNAAFEPCSGDEVARILRQLARLFDHEDTATQLATVAHEGGLPVRDVNGNRVGTAVVTS